MKETSDDKPGFGWLLFIVITLAALAAVIAGVEESDRHFLQKELDDLHHRVSVLEMKR